MSKDRLITKDEMLELIKNTEWEISIFERPSFKNITLLLKVLKQLLSEKEL